MGRDRSFIFGSVPLADIKTVKNHSGVTVNDVVLALVSSSLRNYLLAQGELPEESLRSFIAVSLRKDGDDQFSNKVTSRSVTLAPALPHPLQRLQAIAEETSLAHHRRTSGGTGGVPGSGREERAAWQSQGRRVAGEGCPETRLHCQEEQVACRAWRRHATSASSAPSARARVSPGRGCGFTRRNAWWRCRRRSRAVGLRHAMTVHSVHEFNVVRLTAPGARMNPETASSEFPPAGVLGLPPLTTVTVLGGTICYREARGPEGAPVVLLLHGILATSGLNWMHAFAPLSRHFRVIAPDLCGHGSDAFHRQQFTLEHCADDVAALIAVLRLQRVIVVGYSMGGMVAQYVARRHGSLIGGLVLSGVDWGSRQYGRAATLIGPVFMETAVRLVQLQVCLLRAPVALLRRLGGQKNDGREPGRLLTAAGEVRGHNPRAIGGAVRAITMFRSIDWLHEIRVPTTVLVTLRDSLFPQAEQRRMAKAIKAARVREFDGGHVSCQLPEYATALAEACRELGTRMARSTR